jgi:hypothetical protein
MLNLGDPTPMGYAEIGLLNHLKAENTIVLSIPVLFLVLKLDISTASTSSARAVVLCEGRHTDYDAYSSRSFTPPKHKNELARGIIESSIVLSRTGMSRKDCTDNAQVFLLHHPHYTMITKVFDGKIYLFNVTPQLVNAAMILFTNSQSHSLAFSLRFFHFTGVAKENFPQLSSSFLDIDNPMLSRHSTISFTTSYLPEIESQTEKDPVQGSSHGLD